MDIIALLPILFFSIVLHEFAHGFVAYRLGDDTAYLSDRLTLNPLKHVDIMGTLVVPGLCYMMGWPLFGWAKPVPVNPMRLPSPRKDMGKVAVAGPAVNLLLAILFAGILKLIIILQGSLSVQTVQALAHMLQYGVLINVFLAIFNLMPIPPLDGGRIVTALLPVQKAVWYDQVLGRFGMLIVFALILTGVVKYLLLPPAQLVLIGISKIFGL
ncbi:MAG: site-2 protease family protein [Elusimicrobiaceae bacterium]|nr:site-2 protease family protein [Elusimicrobiaceae bacterium]